LFDEEEQKIDIKLNKSDIDQLFKKPKESKSLKIAKNIFKWTSALILIVIISFGIVNGPALYNNAKYYVYNNLLNKQYPSSVSDFSVSADIAQNIRKNNYLIIPKIGVDSQVQFGIDQSQLKEKLKNGPVQLKGSSLPSDKNGNVFIVGNSSYYMWIGNPGASVFSLLHNIKINDKILLTYNNVGYVYQVEKVETIQSTDIKINKPTNKKLLTLMTYSPIGTYFNKLIITANQINSTQTTSPVNDESYEKEKFTENESNIKSIPTVSTSPLPANTDLKFLPDIN